MSNDILICDLRVFSANTDGLARAELTAHPTGYRLTPLSVADTHDLAHAYAAAYPPEVGAASFDEAVAEITATFAGDYGTIRFDASFAVRREDGAAVGAILVTERSIWDEGLPGPFIIDLFIHPANRNEGSGRKLVEHAMRACAEQGDTSLSLRFGEGTSDAASRIYCELGFRAP